MASKRTQRNFGGLTLGAACAAVLAAAPAARATSWWLPSNHAEHGESLDSLFNLIFWLTSVVMIGVFAAMVYFMVKYRHRRDAQRRAHFSHGNPRLEMIWTIVPAVILIFVSLYSKRVWEEYRYGKPGETRKPATILIIAETFFWNAIHAGADGKVGQYLVYPKPTDRLWPKGGEAPADTSGPADLAHADAVSAINEYIASSNPLGKVYDEPYGKDDVYLGTSAPIYLPQGRPVKVQLSSKDVVHDLFLPNFRVRLDAVPGLRGTLTFVPIGPTSREREEDPANRKTFANMDELAKFVSKLDHPENQNWLIRIDDKSGPAAVGGKGGVTFNTDEEAQAWRYNGTAGGRWQYTGANEKPIIADREALTVERVKALQAIGVKEVIASRSGVFEVVCGELCGNGHFSMRSTAVVLPAAEYAERFESAPKVDQATVGGTNEPLAVK